MKKKETEIKKFLHVLQLVLHFTTCSSTCSSFYNLFFPNKTQHPRTQTHHKNTKEKKKQIIISHSFIDEPKFSHSFLTRTTLSVSRSKQHDHSKSRSTLTVSRPKQNDKSDRFEEEHHCFSGGDGLAGIGEGERGRSDPARIVGLISFSLSLSLNSNHGLKCSCDNKKNGLMIFKVYTFLTNTLKMKKKRKKKQRSNTNTDPTSKNSNPSQEHQRKEKTNYHLSLFH